MLQTAYCRVGDVYGISTHQGQGIYKGNVAEVTEVSRMEIQIQRS